MYENNKITSTVVCRENWQVNIYKPFRLTVTYCPFCLRSPSGPAPRFWASNPLTTKRDSFAISSRQFNAVYPSQALISTGNITVSLCACLLIYWLPLHMVEFNGYANACTLPLKVHNRFFCIFLLYKNIYHVKTSLVEERLSYRKNLV